MKKIFLVRLLSMLLMVATVLCSQVQAQQAAALPGGKKPNIIFILADDLGYGDVGVLYQNGRKKEGKHAFGTPNLDKMAQEGMLLTRHYVPAPVCAPSRASLLLGQHQGHAAVRNNQFDKALPNNHTLASVLKEAGYSTAIVGKYGLQGTTGNSPETWEAYPTKRGFDYFFGYVRHVDGHNHYPAHKARMRPPVEVYEGNKEISAQLKGCYTTDLFTAVAKKWIVGQKKERAQQPFFLYLAYDAPHAGLQVPSLPFPAGGGLNGGLQWQGKKDGFINTATDTIDTYIHPEFAGQNWPESQKRFATMVRRLDESIGDLLQLLKDLRIDKETLVVFTSDNGPHHESYGYGDYEPTFFRSYGEMDGVKRDVWEGGIRVPTIVRWPAHIPENRRNASPSGFHDWMPTFAALAKLHAPANTDGVSLLPLLLGKKRARESTVYIEYSVNGITPLYPDFNSSHKGGKRGEMQVIYLDGYKGVRYNIQAADDDFRIYDTDADPKETNDLSKQSSFFQRLQQRMKERVLQLRRPDTSALRPYDTALIPAIDQKRNKSAPFRFRLHKVKTLWVPSAASMKAPAKVGSAKEISLKGLGLQGPAVVEWQGYIDVPEAGEYTFSLQTNGKMVIRLHDALLFDADKLYESGKLMHSRIRLQKGRHPVHAVYSTDGQPKPTMHLSWRGAEVAKASEKATRHW